MPPSGASRSSRWWSSRPASTSAPTSSGHVPWSAPGRTWPTAWWASRRTARPRSWSAARAAACARTSTSGPATTTPRRLAIYTDLGLLSDDSCARARTSRTCSTCSPGWPARTATAGCSWRPVSLRTGHPGAHRGGGRATAVARRRPDRAQGQLHRRPGRHRGAVRGEPGRRAHRPHRARHVLGGAGRAARQRDHRGALGRGPLPGALPDPVLRPG